jgi:hypothetical protein
MRLHSIFTRHDDRHICPGKTHAGAHRSQSVLKPAVKC